MRYVRIAMIEVDEDGNILGTPDEKDEKNFFLRYGIINRDKKNRVIFSTKDVENNNTKFFSMIGKGTDDFDWEQFDAEMKRKAQQEMEMLDKEEEEEEEQLNSYGSY